MLWHPKSAHPETLLRNMSVEKKKEKEKAWGAHQVESHAHGPGILSAQYGPVVPVIFEFKVCGRSLCPSRVEPALRLSVDVHLSSPLVLVVVVGVILDGSGPRHACVPKGGSRRHEKCIVDVSRVREHHEVEREEPDFATGNDTEVRWPQRRVRENIVQYRAVVVLKIVQRSRRKIRICSRRTFLSLFFSASYDTIRGKGVDPPRYSAHDSAALPAAAAADYSYVFHFELCGGEHFGTAYALIR